MNYNTAGLIFGREENYLDHVGTLCAFLSIPLVVTDDLMDQLAREYYPSLIVEFIDPMKAAHVLVRRYDVIFTCLPTPIFDQFVLFEEHAQRKKLRSFWLGHGLSDKPTLGGLSHEKLLLVYGEKMLATLIKEKVLPKIFRYVTIGNMRYQYYKKLAPFYDKIVEQRVLSRLTKNNLTILYAPTWDEPTHEKYLPLLLEQLPDDINLIIRPHPHSLERHPGLFEMIKGKYGAKSNILLLENFPPVYPILSIADAFLGDHSSLGYDYLVFDRPLFFLTEEWAPLHDVGITISLKDAKKTFSIIRDNLTTPFPRKELLSYAFTPIDDYETVRTEIKTAYEDYFDEELHLL